MSKRNIVHIEIPTANNTASSKFYAELFGWKMEHIPEMDYTLWEPEVAPGGGFSPTGEGGRPGEVLIYVDSDDIEADLRRVAELGGEIIQEKMEIPNTGWFGIFKDPTGNAIALYTSMNPAFNRQD